MKVYMFVKGIDFCLFLQLFDLILEVSNTCEI